MDADRWKSGSGFQCMVLVVWSNRCCDFCSEPASINSPRMPYANRTNHSWECKRRRERVSNKAKRRVASEVNIVV